MKEGERREEMQMDQNGEESVLMRDNYWSSGHLSGGKRKFLGALLRWSFTLRPKSILLQLHQGQLVRGRGYRGGRGGEGVKGEERSMKKPNISAPTGMRINVNLGVVWDWTTETKCHSVHMLWIFICGGSLMAV